MSATESGAGVAVVAANGGPPRERRALVALLAALEGALLLVASVLAYLYRPQPIPVVQPLGCCSSSGGICITPGGPVNPVPYPSCPAEASSQLAMLIAVVCSAVALLVLPAVIGLVSRRWQSALAAPAIPLWLALLVVVALSLVADSSAYTGGAVGILSGLSAWTLALDVAGQALGVLLLASALGGLGWLARRGFSR